MVKSRSRDGNSQTASCHRFPLVSFSLPPLPLLTDLVGLHESGESHVVLPHREEGLHHERVIGLGAGTNETWVEMKIKETKGNGDNGCNTHTRSGQNETNKIKTDE